MFVIEKKRSDVEMTKRGFKDFAYEEREESTI